MGIALITGGSRGIGAATALVLAQDGHDVAVAYGTNAAAADRVAIRSATAVDRRRRSPRTLPIPRRRAA